MIRGADTLFNTEVAKVRYTAGLWLIVMHVRISISFVAGVINVIIRNTYQLTNLAVSKKTNFENKFISKR